MEPDSTVKSPSRHLNEQEPLRIMESWNRGDKTIRIEKKLLFLNETEKVDGRDVYTPHIQPHKIVILRSGMPGTRNSMSDSNGVNFSYHEDGNSLYRESGISRKQEKKELQALNEQLAAYINQAAILKSEKAILEEKVHELETARAEQMNVTTEMYIKELSESRRMNNELSNKNMKLKIEIGSIQERMKEQKRRLEAAYKVVDELRVEVASKDTKISEYESKNYLLKSRFEFAEKDRKKEKGLLERLQEELNATRDDLNKQTIAYIEAENSRQALIEDMAFLKEVHEEALKERHRPTEPNKDVENRQHWESEVKDALMKIEEGYELHLTSVRSEIERSHQLQIKQMEAKVMRRLNEMSRFEEESKKLKASHVSQRDQIILLKSETHGSHVQQCV